MKALKITVKKVDKQKAVVWLDSALDSLDDSVTVEIVVKKKAKKRSLNANAYAWVLMDKLAEAYGVPPELVYREQLKDIGGHGTFVSVGVAAEDVVRRLWETRGLGWTVMRCGEHDGVVDLLLNYGSSVFNTYQMSRLIENLIAECKAFGIETLPQAEIDSLIALWEGAA